MVIVLYPKRSGVAQPIAKSDGSQQLVIPEELSGSRHHLRSDQVLLTYPHQPDNGAVCHEHKAIQSLVLGDLVLAVHQEVVAPGELKAIH